MNLNHDLGKIMEGSKTVLANMKSNIVYNVGLHQVQGTFLGWQSQVFCQGINYSFISDQLCLKFDQQVKCNFIYIGKAYRKCWWNKWFTAKMVGVVMVIGKLLYLMQTRYGQNGIFVNKPKKMRQYLVQNSPYNQFVIKSHRNAPLRQSIQKQEQPSKDSSKFALKKQLIELVSTTKNKLKTSIEKSKERPLNASVNIKKVKKPSLRLNLKNNQERPYHLSQVNLSLDSDKNSNRYSRVQRSIVFPFNSIQRNEHLKSSISHERNQYHMVRRAKKGSDQMFNFKSKHRSLHKMSGDVDQNKTIRKQDFLQGFRKEKKLGKGGFSVVWQARQVQTDKIYAVKQINAFNQYQTHLSQIMFSTYFFEKGRPKQKFQLHPGINTLLQMQSYSIVGSKAYIVYQKCTSSLGQILFDIYQQTQVDYDKKEEEKNYVIVHKPLYRQLKQSCLFIKNFICQIAQALQLLQSANIVHSDIKTSNILINLFDNMKRYTFKLIDYGSSFFFQNLKQYRLATPEYMPPELINFLNKQKGRPYSQEILHYTDSYHNISAIDIWGLGCIIVEIIHGVPLWLNNKVKIKVEGGQKIVSGLFATESRIYVEILQKQLALIKDVDNFLNNQNNTKVILDNDLKMIIKRMLELDPEKRIKPSEILQLLRSESIQTII